MLEQLQKEDEDFFSDELLDINLALQDSAKARLDSLGYEGARDKALRSRPLLGYELGLAGQLMAYNRAEGLVVGASATVKSPRYGGLGITAQSAYATGPGEFRWYGVGFVPFSFGDVGLEARAGYADRVVPYGTNRVVANGVRMLLLSVDDQDYYRSRGGFCRLNLRVGALRGTADYTAVDVISVPATTSFGIFGNGDNLCCNAVVDDGRDQSVGLALRWGNLVGRRETVRVAYRMGGGGLGGDFTYNVFQASAGIRRYLMVHELTVEAAVNRTGASPPVQRLADLGSLSTIRGFGRRSLVGESSLFTRAELLIGWDLFRAAHVPLLKGARIQFIPFGDAGRVWKGNSETWRTSLGMGLQKYLGPFGQGANVRLDAAFPIGPGRTDDVYLYLYFSRGLF